MFSALENYSTVSNLTLNAKKTKWILQSTTQMFRVHSLDSCTLYVNCKGGPLDSVQSAKLLRLHLDQYLTLNEYITKTLASFYGTLAVLRKLKHMAPYHLRKQLAECIVIIEAEAVSSVQKKDKMADGSGFPSPLSCVVVNLLIFEGKGWVISDKNGGKVTKIVFLSEVSSLIISSKEQEKLIT